MATSDEAFAAWCAFLAPTEGGLSTDPDDPGNWTGGSKGAGELKGSKYGISAASYPALDIASLTLAEANQIRRDDYWTPVRGDDLPPALAFLVADAAYNSGVGEASRLLQASVGVAQDGDIGPVTMAAVDAAVAKASAYGLASGWTICCASITSTAAIRCVSPGVERGPGRLVSPPVPLPCAGDVVILSSPASVCTITRRGSPP